MKTWMLMLAALLSTAAHAQNPVGFFKNTKTGYFALVQERQNKPGNYIGVLGQEKKGKLQSAAVYLIDSVGNRLGWTKLVKSSVGTLGVTSSFNPDFEVYVKGDDSNTRLEFVPHGERQCESMELIRSTWGRHWVSYSEFDRTFRYFEDMNTKGKFEFDYSSNSIRGAETRILKELETNRGFLVVRNTEINWAEPDGRAYNGGVSLALSLKKDGVLGKRFEFLMIHLAANTDAQCLGAASLYLGRK